MVGWHHGHEFEQAPGGLACSNSWGLRESDPTERLNNIAAHRLSRLTHESL